MDLRRRLGPFVARGILEAVPTRFQVLQGEFEMWPAVLSTEVTSEEFYRRGLGHPWLRQPLIFSQIGLDHLRIGTGLRSSLQSVISHLHFTYHRGFPAWDLQVAQTHTGGLAELRSRTEELIAGRTRRAQLHRALIRRILIDPDAYHQQFLGEDGWICRAERFEYPLAADVGSLPEQYYSVVGFMNHAARSFPSRPRQVGVSRLPRWMLARATQRLRDGKRFGWFAETR